MLSSKSPQTASRRAQSMFAMLGVTLAMMLAATVHEAQAGNGEPTIVLDSYMGVLGCTGTPTESEALPISLDMCLPDFFNAGNAIVGGKSVPGLVNMQFNCPANTFSYGLNTFGGPICNSTAVSLNQLCYEDGGNSYKYRCLPDICRPDPGTQKAQCDNRVAQCNAWRMNMKWTGAGCKGRRGRPLSDGGCQCKGYCGYTCAKSCSRDPECYWDNRARTCNSKETQLPGNPILKCPVQKYCKSGDQKCLRRLEEAKAGSFLATFAEYKGQ